MDPFQGVNRIPQSLNKYSYAHNDPANLIDPSGNFASLAELSAVNSISSLMFNLQIEGALNSLNPLGVEHEVLDVAKTANRLLGFAALGSAGAKLLTVFGQKLLKKRGVPPSVLANCNLRNSFVEGTLVKTSSGYVPIENINIGDLVWSYNELVDSFEINEVINLITGEGQYNILNVYVKNQKVALTDGHPLFTAGHEWVNAESLTEGQYLLGLFDQVLLIDKIISLEGNYKVYNLNVDKAHSYLVSRNDIVAHNCPMFGALGVQTSSKTMWNRSNKSFRERVDIENPNPGKRPANIHYQREGKGGDHKYFYDPSTEQFYESVTDGVFSQPISNTLNNDLLGRPEIQAAIVKALKFLGEGP